MILATAIWAAMATQILIHQNWMILPHRGNVGLIFT
ncbi:UNVERIFIED_CONTAM: hypothetical protein GTU68_064929 [Idotea baltica]|nr:hypothetical protein [Idotea baltica]